MNEPAIQSYVLLLFLSSSPAELPAHLAKMDRALLGLPKVKETVAACGSFISGDFSRFLRFAKAADYMTLLAATGTVDLARLQILWQAIRASPKALTNRWSLSSLQRLLAFNSEGHARSFLEFYGVQVEEGWAVFPSRTSSPGQGSVLTSDTSPQRCTFPSGADELLRRRAEEALKGGKAALVLGR